MATISKREHFLAVLRGNVEAWHMGFIDDATFTAVRRDTWDAIHRLGEDFAEDVLRTLRDQLPKTTRREQFLAALRENVEAWHMGLIDDATLTAVQRATWDAIHRAGEDVESDVLRTLHNQLPTAGSLAATRAATSGLRYRR
jgi:hypothetical protein